MDNGMYAIEDFGCTVDYSAIANGGAAKLVSGPIQNAKDWEKVKPISLADAPALNRELTSLQLLLDKVQNEQVPVLFTAFSPLTTANKLCGGKLVSQLKELEPQVMHQALQAITDTTIGLVKQARSLGADGIFLASQMSSFDVCTPEIFSEYGVPYDRQVLMASDGWCDAIHAHGTNIMYDLLKDYPVKIFNWHAYETDPTLQKAKQLNKCLLAGLKRFDITKADYEALDWQIDQGRAIMQGRHHIMAPGCVIRYPVNPQVLHYLSDRIRKL
jgi:uroporphyrinogen decarboxylase